MRRRFSIAIDGPSGVGKSVVGRLLAERLGYLFVDTGAMYRAVTWLVLQRGLDPAEDRTVARVAEDARIELTMPTLDDGRAYSVLVDGQDVTWAIRGAEVESAVSIVSRIQEVRTNLVARQRAMGQAGGVVMVGRDIGTTVLPNADLKVYLTASAAERARRRYLELRDRGVETDLADLREDMELRDKIDTERSHSPLRPADDAYIIDTEQRTVEGVVAEIECLLPLH